MRDRCPNRLFKGAGIEKLEAGGVSECRRRIGVASCPAYRSSNASDSIRRERGHGSGAQTKGGKAGALGTTEGNHPSRAAVPPVYLSSVSGITRNPFPRPSLTQAGTSSPSGAGSLSHSKCEKRDSGSEIGSAWHWPDPRSWREQVSTCSLASGSRSCRARRREPKLSHSKRSDPGS